MKQNKTDDRQHALLTVEESDELRALIKESDLSQDDLTWFIGTRFNTTSSSMLKLKRVKGRLRGLLEYLKLKKIINNIDSLINPLVD